MADQHALYTGLRFTFLYADQYQFPQSWVYAPAVVPYSLLRLITRGRAEFELDGVTYHVNAGDVAHIPEGTLLGCRSESDDLRFISIRFLASVKYGDGDFMTEHFGIPPVTGFADRKDVAALFQTINDSAPSASDANVFVIRGSLELLIGALVERSAVAGHRRDIDAASALATSPHRGTTRQRDPRVETIVNHLVHHPDAQVSIDDLCGIAELSPSALRRLFRAHTGKTIGEFRTELKMMTAARMLLVTTDRVGEIGRRVGYRDQNYFARSFRQVFGVSPQAYRRISREQL